MNYYDYHTPYYGLIRAESVEQADELYTKYIAEEPEAPTVISNKEALLALMGGHGENGPAPVQELVELFFETKPDVLLVDGALL